MFMAFPAPYLPLVFLLVLLYNSSYFGIYHTHPYIFLYPLLLLATSSFLLPALLSSTFYYILLLIYYYATG